MGLLMLLAVFDDHTVVDVSGDALPILLQLQASLLRLAFLPLLSSSTLRRLYPSVTGILIAVDAGDPAYASAYAVACIPAAASIPGPASTGVCAV
jgi:hypothetical protein